MKVVLLCLPLFFCGAIPFSYLLGKLLLHKDIRDFGDGNPGAANAWKAGGAAVGLVAVLLDVLKGLIPLLLVLSLFDMEGISMAFLAVAPVCGHAFSPFLHFRGGKAVAVTYGVWLALTGLATPGHGHNLGSIRPDPVGRCLDGDGGDGRIIHLSVIHGGGTAFPGDLCFKQRDRFL